MNAGKFDAAAQTRERYVAIASGGKYQLGTMKLLNGNAAEALAVYEEFGKNEDGLNANAKAQRMAGLAMAHHDLGETGKANAALTELLSAEGQKMWLLTQVNAWMGRKDAAFGWLQLLAEQKLPEARRGVFDPGDRKLYDDPRWDAWRESIGMSAERLDAIEFNPDLPE